MRLLIQRVKEAAVTVEGQVVERIGPGVLVLIGITHTDTPKESAYLANKLVSLRLFADTEGKTNQSLLDVKGGALLISQFTLYADCNNGRRPSFTQAAPPELAKPLYEHFVQEVSRLGVPVAQGVFGAYMEVSLVNDGPVTLILEHEADS